MADKLSAKLFIALKVRNIFHQAIHTISCVLHHWSSRERERELKLFEIIKQFGVVVERALWLFTGG